MDLLNETDMLAVKLAETPMEQNVDLNGDDSIIFSNKRRYWSLVGKFVYLTITKLDINFLVSAVSQFMEAPEQIHWKAMCRILKYLKGTIGMGLLYRRRSYSNSSLDVVSFLDVD